VCAGKLIKSMSKEQLAVLQAVYHAIEDAGLTLQQLHNTTTGIFVGGYTSFTCSPQAPDEATLRGRLMSTLSDQVRSPFHQI
jgi:acyl transferase domain-containing protein